MRSRNAGRATRLLAAGAVLALAACRAGKVLEPFESTYVSDGLEQQIRVQPDDTGETFGLTSRLVNRGSTPVTIRVVTCWLNPKENLRANVELVARAVPGCIWQPNVITLAPGEASRPVWFVGQFDRPGRHTIRVRHALEPEIWGTIRVRAR